MRAVLDANVFYSTWVTDPLLSFADIELFEPVWSERIMEEVRRHLPEIWLRATEEGVARYLRTVAMAFPEAMVTGWEPLERAVTLPDLDDRHVLAVAIKARADAVVTSNLKDFPAKRLERFGLHAMSPDDFLALLFDENPREAMVAVHSLVDSKRYPPRSMEEEIERLRDLGLARFAGRLAAMAQSTLVVSDDLRGS